MGEKVLTIYGAFFPEFDLMIYINNFHMVSG